MEIIKMIDTFAFTVVIIGTPVLYALAVYGITWLIMNVGRKDKSC